MTSIDDLPRYDPAQTYRWNYEHAPEPLDLQPPPIPGEWTFCEREVDSPLGVPAGPLLNGRWCLYYASLGFDLLTYKTVRSQERACYELPNLQPVDCRQLRGDEADLPASAIMRGSWAVSFGMPSAAPGIWRADIEQTRKQLPSGKLLSVSVVGTVQQGWSIGQLADDYALCAKWAIQSGGDCVETNFSCPNVSTCDGQLYQQPKDAALIAAKVREAIGDAAYIVKIGYVASHEEAEAIVDALQENVDALAMTNSVATTVVGADGERMFEGEKRGICGDAIREASLAQTKMFAGIIEKRARKLELIGVGGVGSMADVKDYLQAGASSVHLATAAMVDPAVALKIRRDWSGGNKQAISDAQ